MKAEDNFQSYLTTNHINKDRCFLKDERKYNTWVIYVLNACWTIKEYTLILFQSEDVQTSCPVISLLVKIHIIFTRKTSKQVLFRKSALENLPITFEFFTLYLNKYLNAT